MGLLQQGHDAFEPVAQVLVETPVVAVRGDAKWHTLAELIADSKARPEGITVGNSGVGSHTHITSVALFRTAGAHVVDVPFGAAEVITSLLGRQVDAVVQLPAALAEHVKSGQARLLAAMSATRDPAFPQVPTAGELGFDVSLEAWRGIAAPKGTPKEIVAAYEAAIKDTVESREFTEACLRLGARTAFLPADRFGALIARQDGELAQLMEVIGLKQ
jgi:tripartite-type tricarboxylate transporter receptor subunit TctC